MPKPWYGNRQSEEPLVVPSFVVHPYIYPAISFVGKG
jgi:hypothetical protein